MQKYKSRKNSLKRQIKKKFLKKTKKYLKKYQKGGAAHFARVAKAAVHVARVAAPDVVQAAKQTLRRTSDTAAMQAFENGISKAAEHHLSEGTIKAFNKVLKLVAEPSSKKMRPLNVKGGEVQTAAVEAVIRKLKANPNFGKNTLSPLHIAPDSPDSPHSPTARMIMEQMAP